MILQSAWAIPTVFLRRVFSRFAAFPAGASEAVAVELEHNEALTG